MWMMCNCI